MCPALFCSPCKPWLQKAARDRHREAEKEEAGRQGGRERGRKKWREEEDRITDLTNSKTQTTNPHSKLKNKFNSKTTLQIESVI